MAHVRTFVDSTRLRGWDYKSAAWYFVTICTRDRRGYLGRVVSGRMQTSIAGRIVREEWLRTAEVRTTVVLDSFVLMPNHIHGIIVIKEAHPAPQRGASTRIFYPRRPVLQPNSLGSIIGQFKSISTKRIRSRVDSTFGWQPRFHDRIIRGERECDAVRAYIHQNPLKWALDKDNTEGLLI